MRWNNEYEKRRVSAEQAVAEIASGDRIYVSGNAATPYVLLEALAKRRDDLQNVEVTHVLLMGDDPLSRPDAWGRFRHNSLFVGSADRAVVNEGLADYVPVHLHKIPGLFSEGYLPLKGEPP